MRGQYSAIYLAQPWGGYIILMYESPNDICDYGNTLCQKLFAILPKSTCLLFFHLKIHFCLYSMVLLFLSYLAFGISFSINHRCEILFFKKILISKYRYLLMGDLALEAHIFVYIEICILNCFFDICILNCFFDICILNCFYRLVLHKFYVISFL